MYSPTHETSSSSHFSRGRVFSKKKHNRTATLPVCAQEVVALGKLSDENLLEMVHPGRNHPASKMYSQCAGDIRYIYIYMYMFTNLRSGMVGIRGSIVQL